MSSNQTTIDSANASFWNELCGSSAARAWGITDSSTELLRRYDENFLRFYPYLDRHIPWSQSPRQAGSRGRPRLRDGLAKACGERGALHGP